MANASALPRLLAHFFRHAGPAVASVSALIFGCEAYVQLSGISPTALPAPSRIVVQGFEQREALARNSFATFSNAIHSGRSTDLRPPKAEPVLTSTYG